MHFRAIVIIAFITFSLPAHAGAFPDDIFYSGFEGDRTCWKLSELSDPFNVNAVTVSGELTVNGQPFPDSQYDDGEISLRDVFTGDVVLLGNTHTLNYVARVMPGIYDVVYSVQTPGANAPRNTGAMVMKKVVLLTDTTLDINVVAHRISGSFRLNGGAFPASAYDHGDLVLESEFGGRVVLGDSNEETFSNLLVIPGDYQVRFESIQSTLVPVNESGFVSNLSINGDAGSLVINVPVAQLSGTLRHNSALWPESEYADGNFYLENADGDRVFLGNSHDNQYSRKVIPGIYDIYWERETPAETIPANPRAMIASGVSAAGGTLNINVVSHLLNGNFTHNGGAFPNTVLHTGRVVMRDKLTGSESSLGLTYEGNYQQRIIQGSYEVVYQYQQGENVPLNKNAVLNTGLLVNGSGAYNINVTSSSFYTTPFNNGQLFPANALQMGNILLRDPISGDEAVLGKTSQQNLTARLIPGTYDAYYSHLAGNQVPQNKMGLVQKNVIIEEPPLNAAVPPLGSTGYPINVNSLVTYGVISLNGNLPPDNEYDDGVISLRSNDDYVLLGNSHNQNFYARVLYGDYQAYYGVQTPGVLMPHNKNGKLNCVYMDPPIF